jgi:hypothetical protein
MQVHGMLLNSSPQVHHLRHVNDSALYYICAATLSYAPRQMKAGYGYTQN